MRVQEKRVNPKLENDFTEIFSTLYKFLKTSFHLQRQNFLIKKRYRRRIDKKGVRRARKVEETTKSVACWGVGGWLYFRMERVFGGYFPRAGKQKFFFTSRR